MSAHEAPLWLAEKMADLRARRERRRQERAELTEARQHGLKARKRTKLRLTGKENA